MSLPSDLSKRSLKKGIEDETFELYNTAFHMGTYCVRKTSARRLYSSQHQPPGPVRLQIGRSDDFRIDASSSTMA